MAGPVIKIQTGHHLKSNQTCN